MIKYNQSKQVTQQKDKHINGMDILFQITSLSSLLQLKENPMRNNHMILFSND